MPVTVQIDGVGKVQLDDSFKSLSAADQQSTVDEIANQHSAAPQTPGPQPSLMDKITGSPIGRAIHDVVLSPLSSVEHLLGSSVSLDPTKPVIGAPQTAAGKFLQQDASNAEGSYQGSLANNRNTPGYAAALQRAQATQAAMNAPGPYHIPNLHTGLGDQVAAPFAPAAAGLAGLVTGGGLDQANANADIQSQTQAAYAAQHPILSTAAGLVGGLAMGAPTKALAELPAAIPKTVVPSIEDLKAASKAAYKQVDDAGVTVSNDAMNHMADSLEDKLGPRLDPTLHPDATAAYNRVLQYGTDGSKGTQSATFNDLDNLRRVVADASGSPKAADRAMARQVLDHVDNFVDGLTPEHLDTSALDQARADLMSATGQKGSISAQIKGIEKNKPGALIARGAAGADTRANYVDMVNNKLPAAEQTRQAALGDFQAQKSLIDAGPQGVIDALNSARSNWSRAAQASLIQQQIDKAGIKAAGYSQSGMENALRAQFRQLALNDRAMARLTPQVQEAVKAVAAGSPVGNVLRAVGKFAPHGPVATAAGMGTGYMLGGIEGGGVGALALPMVGEAARAGATAMTKAAAQRALTAAALGKSAPTAIPQSVLSLPRLTAQSRAPLGLLNVPPLMLPQLQTTQ